MAYHLVTDDIAKATGQNSYDEVLPLMLIRYCGPGLLGLGITALVAGFMSGMAGNVSAFSTVWTYDIYGAFMNKKASDSHYVAMGRWSTVSRDAGLDRIGVPGDECGRHHGLRAGAVQLLHRAALRHGDPGHAVEARDQGGRASGAAGGNASSIAHVRVGALRSRAHCSYVAINPQAAADGGEPLSRAVELAHLRRRHDHRELDGQSRCRRRSSPDWSTA